MTFTLDRNSVFLILVTTREPRCDGFTLRAAIVLYCVCYLELYDLELAFTSQLLAVEK